MRKVLVIGPGGAGKTTFARAFAQRSGLPLIHLDSLYWRSGWVATPNEAWDRVIEDLTSGDEWVMDGNYGRTLPTRLTACDTVIFLDFPRHVCLWRAVRRWWRYRRHARPDLPPGCPDRLTWEFVSWIWTYQERRRPGILRQLKTLPEGVRAVILRSSRDVKEYLEQVA